MPKLRRLRIEPPLPAAHFRVLIDSEEIGIRKISPIQGLIGGKLRPDLLETVTLSRAVTQCRRLYKWYRDAARGRDAERELTIVQLDAPVGEALNVWVLRHASPVRWTGPGFDAVGDGYASEELELRYKAIAWRRRF